MARAKAVCRCGICGREFVKIAYKAKRADADSYEKWAEENCKVCPECYLAEKSAREKEKAEELLTLYADSVPSLGGTEKQVKWAQDIRAKLVLKSHNAVTELGWFKDSMKDVAQSYIGYMVETEAHSRFWIDNRGVENLFVLDDFTRYAAMIAEERKREYEKTLDLAE